MCNELILEIRRFACGEDEDGSVKASVRVYVFHGEYIHFVRKQALDPPASVRDGCFDQRASHAADVLSTLTAGKNVLDRRGGDVGLLLSGRKFQPGGQQVERAAGAGLDVLKADDALDAWDCVVCKILRGRRLPAE